MVSFVLQTFALFYTLNKHEYVGAFDIHHHRTHLVQNTDADIMDFPYYASLLHCGAAILSENWVVTAATCVNPAPKLLNFVWVGGASFRTSKRVAFDQVVTHGQMGVVSPNVHVPVNDIALLHLSEPLQFSKTIQPVDLPFQDLTRSGQHSVLGLAGRGLNKNGYIVKNLAKMDIIKLTTKECMSYMPRYIRQEIDPLVSSLEKAVTCGVRADRGRGLCEEIAGSPLMDGNTLVGIASFTGVPCEVAKLGFYVNVENYVPWIKSVIGY